MGVIRVTINMTWFGQICQNVIHLDNGEAGYDPADVKSQIETLWIPAVRPMQLGTLNYFKIQVRDMEAVGGLTTDYAININGSAGSAVEGWGCLCYLFSFQTATGGHEGRGRVYLPGAYPGNVVLGRWISASMDQQTTAIGLLTTRFLGATPTSGYNLVVCKRQTLPTPHPVINIIARNVPGVQRRRNIGVGF